MYQRGGLLVRPLLLPTIPPNDDWHLTPSDQAVAGGGADLRRAFPQWDARAKA